MEGTIPSPINVGLLAVILTIVTHDIQGSVRVRSRDLLIFSMSFIEKYAPDILIISLFFYPYFE